VCGYHRQLGACDCVSLCLLAGWLAYRHERHALCYEMGQRRVVAAGVLCTPLPPSLPVRYAVYNINMCNVIRISYRDLQCARYGVHTPPSSLPVRQAVHTQCVILQGGVLYAQPSLSQSATHSNSYCTQICPPAGK